MSLFVKVGSFAKSTGGAPATQAITGLGFQPKCLILWTSGGTVDGTIQTQATRDGRTSLGVASGTAAADQYAGSSTADTAGGGGRRITQKLVCLTDATGATVVSEASLASFDADGFTLTWSTNSVTEAQIIHYLALGGTEVQAKVISTSGPAGNGNFSKTGVGFQPNLVMTVGTVAATALDTAAGSAAMHLGVAASSSSRWAMSSNSGQAVSSAGWRWHRNDRCFLRLNGTGGNAADYDFVSMDADGFTMNRIGGLGTMVWGALCLKVPRVAVGTFTKPTGGAPAAASVSGLGFVPMVVMLASDQDVNRANASSQTGTRFGLSAFTTPGAEASVHSIPDAPNPITFAYLEKSAGAAVKIDNATPAIDAEATGVLGGDGFTLTWNGNDAVATEYGYVAIGFDAPHPQRGMGVVYSRRSNSGRDVRMARGASRRRTN